MRRWVMSLLAVLVIVVAGCSSGPSDSGDRVDSGESSGASGTFGAGGDFSVDAALAEIPARYAEDGTVLTMADLLAASDAAGVARPGSVAETDAVVDWSLAVGGANRDPGTVFVPLPDLLRATPMGNLAEFHEELGWSVLGVDAFVDASKAPNEMLVAVGSGLDPDAVPAAQVVDLGNGVFSAGEGDDHQIDPVNRTLARPLGAPLRMAPQDGRLAVAKARSEVAGWLAGVGPTLAGSERHRQVAGHLDAAKPYAAVVYTEAGAHTARTPGTAATGGSTGGDARLTASYSLVGIGWSTEGGEAVITIVHHFGDDATAESQVAALRSIFENGTSVVDRRAFAERVTVENVEADGPVTVTTLGLTDDGTAMVPFEMLITRDVPFSSPR
jgi:hypothetical protein